MRYAIKFAYDGANFSGSQRQPNLRTVEGVIIDCLIKHRVIEDPKIAKFQVASRTDTGVSALGNVLAFNTDFKKQDILNVLNSKLDDCWFYGLVQVDDEFKPRYAKLRWYRYHLFKDQIRKHPSKGIGKNKKELDLESFQYIFDMFRGTHDFRNFVNPHVENSVRTIDSILASEDGDWILIDIKARAFLWHQVRRLVNAWIKFAGGELIREQLEIALSNPDQKIDFGLAPAELLFLMDIEYDFNFEINSEALQRVRSKLIDQWLDVKHRNDLIRYLLEKV